MSERRIYKIQPIVVNGISVVQVVIDSHYEQKHRSAVSDDLILEMVKE